MKSNFEFLKANPLTSDYFLSAFQAEQSYAMGLYPGEMTIVRTIAENVARDIADQKYLGLQGRSKFNDVLTTLKYQTTIDSDTLELFYQAKQQGNKAAHELAVATKVEEDQKMGLIDLKRLYKLMTWFVNTFYDQDVDPNVFREPAREDFLYSAVIKPSASERNLIYIQSAKTENGHFQDYVGSEKVGKARAGDLARDNSDNSPYLREVATKRIKQYMTTAGVPTNLQWVELAYRPADGKWFTDKDVHRVLERSGVKHSKNLAGDEWFETDLETAKRAIKAVKENRSSINVEQPGYENGTQVVLRSEQKDAVKTAKTAFKKYDRVLWNAKMRFGKTLSALQLIKEEHYQHVLIMTHRPIVKGSWFDDFKKIGMDKEGYIYGSNDIGEKFENLKNGKQPFIYFASLQNLTGSKMIGGKVKDKNRDIFKEHWDLVIIDEAHEGAQTDLAKRVLNEVYDKDTKILEMSGTPFNILDQYKEDQVYTWDYVMEQRAKQQWSIDHPHEENPYLGLPKVNMFTFEMNKSFNDPAFTQLGTRSFNFKEFFRVNDQGKFVYENKVKQFLRNITTPSEHTKYPFSTKEFRDQLRHTLWIMPGIKEANAMEKLLKADPVLGEINGYKIVNVVKNMTGEDKGETDQSDVDLVNNAIGNDPAATKTITLTVRKLTTGVTIKPWTGVVFLSNISSAMQYLQAAFRAQTPYSSPTFGRKTDCYIFDFAPDRALTVMAEAAQMNSSVGKRTSNIQKQRMGTLMNFLPIIGEQGNRMKPFHVDSMLKQIKKVYAEKAVRSGFEDDSLYSDELLMIKEADLEDFKDLKSIVGKTKRENTKVKVNINDQGLTDEQYDKAVKGQKKPKKERSPEEQAAIDRMNAMKKQRRTLISILRSISIRIPLMIYGMDEDLSKDISINTFVEKVDDQSWTEFMPKGVDKPLFCKFIKYYDPQVFLEAGQIIRQKVKKLDNADPIERIEKLTGILGTFHNPDKETVLTPWRVVNMHLGKTVGGLSFFDGNYQYNTVNGGSANHWVNTNYTDRIFKPVTHILEINSKTGTYPLYMAASLYWKEFQELNEQTAGKFTLENELFIWQKILRENIFMIAKTPMAKSIAIRTLCGFQNFDTNIEYIDGIVKGAEQDIDAEVELIKERFGKVKFDVVVGNPPYQAETAGTRSSQKSIYYEFMELAYRLSDLSTLITPARFLFNAGDTPNSFNQSILNDKHFKVIFYEKNSVLIFPRTDIKGGIAISLYDRNEEFEPIKLFIPFKNLKSIYDKVVPTLSETGSLTDIIFAANKLNLDALYKNYPEDKKKVSSHGHERRLQSNIFKLDAIHDYRGTNDYGVYGVSKGKRTVKYIKQEYIDTKMSNNIKNYKIILPKSNGSGTLGESLSSPMIGKPMIGKPMIGYTYTFIGIGSFKNRNEAEAALKYVKSKFARVMLGILKVTQDNTPEKWKLVPLQDFTTQSDIDWSKSISEIDQQLYKKYKLSPDEINFIESKVQAME